MSFDYLLTVSGEWMNSFREVALRLGLLESDNYIEETLEEAIGFQMPSSLRLFFVTLLFYYSPADPKLLWNRFEKDLSADYLHARKYTSYSNCEIQNRVLEDIDKSLVQMGKSISEFHIVTDSFAAPERITREVDSERNIVVDPEDMLLPSKLNAEQRYAFDLILQSVFSSEGKAFFIDGPCGTGKTFLYQSLLSGLRSQGYIVIAVATSGVAASILPRGRTAHSRFKIALNFAKSKTCQLSKQSSVAKLICESKLILWDEASMAKRQTIEAFNCLLQDLKDSDLPFGGHVVVFGGEFRQIRLVIGKGQQERIPRESQKVDPCLTCGYCGKTNHTEDECWVKGRKCLIYGSTDHQINNCLKKQPRGNSAQQVDRTKSK
ncbi:uncharacterized protein [Coffea arabica]|uniref:ATP-dependent DNA helicase n=1 Tax=Coffea arabica TaxID=13443 RepID=A0ABM4WQ39_COFAR